MNKHWEVEKIDEEDMSFLLLVLVCIMMEQVTDVATEVMKRQR